MRRARTGIIARLPADLRLQINLKLRDNIPAAAIVAWLKAEHAVALKKAKAGKNLIRNLSNWRKGGHQDWQREQQRLEEMRVQQQFALELASQNSVNVERANVAMAASHICETLQDFNIADFKAKLKDKPELYTVLLDALSKLCRASQNERRLQLDLTKYQDKVAEQKEKIQRQLGLARAGGLTPEILATIEESLHLL